MSTESKSLTQRKQRDAKTQREIFFGTLIGMELAKYELERSFVRVFKKQLIHEEHGVSRRVRQIQMF